MTVNTGQYLEQMTNTTRALGSKAMSSDAMFVPIGYEHIKLLAKQFPTPILSPGGEVEVPGPNGSTTFEPQQLKTAQQGQLTFHETTAGSVREFLSSIVARGGKFDAWVYEGTDDQYHRADKIKQCFLVIDNPDRDWENKAQVLTISGTLFFHYYGESLPSNIAS